MVIAKICGNDQDLKSVANLAALRPLPALASLLGGLRR
jgi:hypothetical protein